MNKVTDRQTDRQTESKTDGVSHTEKDRKETERSRQTKKLTKLQTCTDGPKRRTDLETYRKTDRLRSYQADGLRRFNTARCQTVRSTDQTTEVCRSTDQTHDGLADP